MIHNISLIERILLYLDILPHPILDSQMHVVAGRALQAAVKLGMIDGLEERPRRAEDLASECNISVAGTAVILDCLTAMGYTERGSAGSYRLSIRGRRFLSRRSKHSLRDMILFGDYSFSRLQQVEEAIKHGGAKEATLESFTDKEWDILNNAMVELADLNMKETTKLAPLRGYHRRLLDLGGSHGLYAIAYCLKNPSLKATVIDLEPTKRHAERMISKYGLKNRVRFQAGDFMSQPIGTGFDAVLVNNVIHGLAPAENEDLMKKVKRALNPGGYIIIQDQIKNMARGTELAQLFAATMGLMIFNLAGGRTYSFVEVGQWLKRAGFSRTTLKKMRAPGFAIITARKNF